MTKNEYILRNGFRHRDAIWLYPDQIKENSFGDLCRIIGKQMCSQIIYISMVLGIKKKILIIMRSSSTFTY